MKATRIVLSLTVLAAGALTAATAGAAFVSVEATDNATVQPAGPRSGSSGKAFYNVEGSSNGNFASFGIADFVFPSPGFTVTDITGATLKLTQANAGFSTDGPVSFYLTDQTGVDIQPTNTSLQYVSGMDGAAGVDSELLPIAALGSGTYTVGTTGDVDSYSLSFSGGALTSLLSAINSGSTLRLVMTPDSSTTAATWAGATNDTYAGPTLELTTVPEPTALVLVGLMGLAFVGSTCRRSRSS